MHIEVKCGAFFLFLLAAAYDAYLRHFLKGAE